MSEETTERDPTELTRDTSFGEVLGAQSPSKKFDRLAYSLFGEFFHKHASQLRWVEDKLAEANRSEDIDLYASRMLLISLLIGAIGLVLGILSVLVLQLAGVLPQFDTGLRYPELIAQILWILRPLIFAIVFGGLLVIVLAGLSFFIGLYQPAYKASIRKRRIDQTLPHAVTFMYALSKGGMSFIEVLNRISSAEGTYGEVSKEFQQVVKEMEFFSLGLSEALNRSSQRTPSTKFEDFCDDLRGILESGADTTKFLQDKSNEYREDAEQEQESFLDTLELLGEVYVTAFVAGPLFLIIITVILALMGGGGTMQLYFIVYLILPLMNVMYFMFLNTITPDEGHLDSTLDVENPVNIPLDELESRIEELGGDERLERMLAKQRREHREEFLRHPIRMMSEKPEYTFIVTAPIAVIAWILPFALGIAAPFWTMFVEQPIVNTTYMFTIPFIITILPYTLLYEMKVRREGRLMGRFPDALKRLASANAIGMTLNEALEAVSENTSGQMGDEFERIKNDIVWHHDVKYALISFANRIRVQIVARTIKLLTEAAESTGDVENVLEVAAKDVNTQYRLKKKQSQTMMMYTAVILISFFVYLFVIVMLDSTFLERISGAEFSAGEDLPSGDEDVPGGAPGGGVGGGLGGGVNVSLSDVPVQKFRMVFFHSTIVQSIGSGLLAGQLGSNDPLKGLKFTILLLICSTMVFFLFTGG